MRRRTAFLPLSFFVWLALIASLHGAQKVYSTGKFVDVQQKTREKVDVYLVNTPVTTAVPYFEVSVELEGMDYVAEYTPRHSGEELPEAWKPGESVQGRVEKHRLFLKRPDGTETQFIIDKRRPEGKEKTHE
jgi:hypothetical protein